MHLPIPTTLSGQSANQTRVTVLHITSQTSALTLGTRRELARCDEEIRTLDPRPIGLDRKLMASISERIFQPELLSPLEN